MPFDVITPLSMITIAATSPRSIYARAMLIEVSFKFLGFRARQARELSGRISLRLLECFRRISLIDQSRACYSI